MKNLIKNTFIIKLLHLGITKNTRKLEKTKIEIFNAVVVAGLFILIINIFYCTFFHKDDNGEELIYYGVTCTSLIITLFLMYKEKVQIAFIVAFSILPLAIFLMSVNLNDRAVIYFELVLAMCTFAFFRSLKIVIPFSLLICAYFIYGIYLQIYNTDLNRYREFSADEIISLIGFGLLLYLTMYFFKSRLNAYQKMVSKQRKQLQVFNAKLKDSELELRERNHVLNKVFSIVSHDLRIPVEGLKMMTKGSKNNEELVSDFYEILPDFKNELNKMSSLFDNLISWAKMELDNKIFVLHEVDVNEVYYKVFSQVAYPASVKKIKIIKQVENNIKCQADFILLEIVLRNIISNAIKFTPELGVITVKSYTQGNQFYLQVIDTGVGMDNATINAITKKGFFSTKGTNEELGSGLGLMICSDMITKCKGILTIESEKGKGSCITIKLPSISAIDVEVINKPFSQIA